MKPTYGIMAIMINKMKKQQPRSFAWVVVYYASVTFVSSATTLPSFRSQPMPR